MGLRKSLSDVLSARLPIPLLCRRNLYVERALQERAAAAGALECIEAHLLCLEAELDNLSAQDPASRATMNRINDLIGDIRASATYDECEMMLADAD